MRRSSASTSVTVSARSSGVDIGNGTPSSCWQMSTAMMSAPSCASRTAWLRPWPRAAPVMKATLPATRPGIVTSFKRVFSGDEHGERLPAADRRRRGEPGRVGVDVPFGEALQDLLQRYASLQPGERRAEAVMDAPAERHRHAELPVNVEEVAVGVAAVVAVRGGDEQEHGAALGHPLPVPFDVPARRTAR